MIYEFEGRTEKEAIDRAASDLGLQRDSFDVEIMETQKGGLFKKGYVKIQVHTSEAASRNVVQEQTRSPNQRVVEIDDLNKSVIEYIEKIISLMGIKGRAEIQFHQKNKNKIGINIESESSSILIGRKGKTLDSLQLLTNIYSGSLGHANMRFILDCENYRLRREESLVKLAYSVAERVRDTHRSILLEPMNPFDRRLIHATINDIGDVETKSEGEGMYKQVRVIYKGSSL